jgi:hypothetical protein
MRKDENDYLKAPTLSNTPGANGTGGKYCTSLLE